MELTLENILTLSRNPSLIEVLLENTTSSELFTIVAYIDSQMNQWVQQKELVSQRTLYYRLLKRAYELDGNTTETELCRLILQRHDMRRRVETWDRDFYRQIAGI